MNYWSTFVVIMVTTIISSGMIASIDGLVYNICTSDGPHGINSLPPQNISYTGVSLKILKTNPTGSLDIEISSNGKIKDIILWAEFREKSQNELHVGAFEPIVGHAYAEGCSGLPNSTITNYEDFTNTSQIIYEWNPPAGTKVKHHKYHVCKKYGKKGHKHHNHHHKKPCHGNHHCKKPNNKHHKHKKHDCEKHHHSHHHSHSHHHHSHHQSHSHHHHSHHQSHSHHHHSHSHHHSHHHSNYHKFIFKGIALLENDPFKFYVFTLDKPVYIKGKIPSDTLSDISSILTTGESSSTEVYVSSFDNTTTTSDASNFRSRREVTIVRFLVAGMLIFLHNIMTM